MSSELMLDFSFRTIFPQQFKTVKRQVRIGTWHFSAKISTWMTSPMRKNAIWLSGGVVLVLLLVVVTGQGWYTKLGWMHSPLAIVDIHGGFLPFSCEILQGVYNIYIYIDINLTWDSSPQKVRRLLCDKKRYIMRIEGLTLKVKTHSESL